MLKMLPFFLISLLLVSAVFAGDELAVVWEKSMSQGTLPRWFDTQNMTRGLSYGKIGSDERVFVVSRNGGNFIYLLDAANGDSLGRLDNTGITGGTLHISDVGVSDDGLVFVCNLAAGGVFKVYKYTDIAAAPVEAINYDATGKRLGDKLTVVGSANDNSLAIIAASANSNDVVWFTTADSGATFTPNVVSIGVTGGSASVSPLAGGDFYWNATGSNPKKFTSTGTLMGTVPGTVVATGSNAISYLTTLGQHDYFITFAYGSGNENARIVKSPTSAPENARLYSVTPGLGPNANANGTGDVSMKANADGSFTIFVLSTNNGLGAYKVVFPVPPIEPVNMALNWEKGVGDLPFFANDHNTRGMGFNPVTNHLLVASRTGAPLIHVLDAETGAALDTLDMTGVTGGTYALNKVVCDANGVIYACNLALANGEFKFYRWADETATPTLAFAGIVLARAGDAFNLSGTDASTIIYASGSGSAEIAVFTTTDGNSFTAQTPVPVAAGTARGGIAPVANRLDADLWINGTGTTLRHIAGNGSVIAEVPGTLLAASWMNAAYIESPNSAKLIAVNANNVTNDIRKVQVWDVTASDTEPVLWGVAEAGNLERKNTNAVGELAFRHNPDGTVTLFQLTTNNSIASWALAVPDVQPVISIAEARIDANGDFIPDLKDEIVTIQGVITTPNYTTKTQYYMQDETAGIVLFSGSVTLALKPGDEILVTGKITQYRGLTELTDFTMDDVKILGSDKSITPNLITIAGLGEAVESQLVQLDSVWMVDPTQWPAEGSGARVYLTDGKDTTYVYIDADTNLDGWTPPTGLLRVIAVADQYTSSAAVLNDGYSLRGISPEGFIDINPPVLPVIVINEINYNPAEVDNDTTEFIELFNAGDTEANLSGYRFTDGVELILPDGTVLPAGSFLVIANDSAGFHGHYGFPAHFIFDGGLKNSSEQVEFSAPDSTVIDAVTFSDSDPWPTAPDGNGPSLELIEPTLDNSLAENWQASYVDGGTPGAVNSKAPVFVPDALFPLWGLTQANGNFPAYISTANYTRGMAYGKVNGEDRVYVVTRFGPHRIVIYSALTGDSLGVIEKPAAAEGVGLFHLNAVDVSDDGIIFACNMTLGSDATHPFRVYRWDSETADAQTVISYDGGVGRLGDMFSVFGKASDNSLTIFAAVSGSNKWVKFTTNDNGLTFAQTVISITGGSFGTLPNIAQAHDGSLYLKSYGKPLVHFSADGAVIDTISTEVVGTGASKISYFGDETRQQLVVYYPDLNGAGGAEKLTVVDLTQGDAAAKVTHFSASIGKVPNGNGVGSVDVMPVAENFVYFILGTNNGLAAFSSSSDLVLATLDTLFYGNTPTLLANPYGAGYIVGTNGYGDLGKFQRFDFKENDTLHGFRFYFAKKEIVGEPDTLNLVVRTVAAQGAPGLLLASVQTTTQMLDTTGVGNIFFLNAPITVSGPVFVGFEWTAVTDDIFALFADKDGEGDGAARAWELFSDGKYNDFGTILEPDYSWGLDVDLWIAAYYKLGRPSAVENNGDVNSPTNFWVSQNYPNPFNPNTQIKLVTPEAGNVEIAVFNIMGQKVATIFNGKLTAGMHQFDFKAENLSSGIYFYQVKTARFQAVKKMTLLK